MTKQYWIIEGLIFGVIMLIFSSFIDYISGDFNFDGFGRRVIIWIAGGLLYGLTMKFVRERAAKKG